MQTHTAHKAHGILLIALFSFAAFYVAQFEWVKALSLSPLIVGIVMGMLYANSLRNHLPETWVPGIKFCTKQILRTGIVLYGFRLTLTQVMEVGLPAIVVDCIIIGGTIGLGVLLGRWLKMDWDAALITSTGSAICGAAAVLGAEPVIKCESHKTAIAVSTVVIFGTLAMFLYPVMFRLGWLAGLDNTQVAIYTGSTLHEVAHVAGAGNAMDPTDALGIAGTATITKMIRVMLLAPVLIIMAYCLKPVFAKKYAALAEPSDEEYAEEVAATDVAQAATGKKDHKAPKGGRTKITIPWFAFGFLAIILVNTAIQTIADGCGAGVQDFLATALYGKGSWMESFDTFLLTMAMTALGTDTSIDKFKQAGAKPFVLAGIIWLWLLGGGYLLAKYLVPVL